VIAFIFADLIALPLVLVYRKYYGTRLTVRLFATFYAVMALSGLAVEGLFRLLGIVPGERPSSVVTTKFEWDHTTFLNIVAVGAFALLYGLHRNRARLGGGCSHSTDVVCGMQVETASAPAHAVHRNVDYWFCSDRCRQRFQEAPDRFTGPGTATQASTPLQT
jgi:YHS domain-containing protein